jgi:hypothetical protein
MRSLTAFGTQIRLVPINALFVTCSLEKGKVQKEELDFWRAAGERGPDGVDEGAGRDRQGSSLLRAKRVLDVCVRPPNVELW